MIRSICHDVEVSPTTFAELLQMDGVHEELTLRSTFGFMAFHGGGLEALTDIVAREAAAQSNASYYAVIHPDGDPLICHQHVFNQMNLPRCAHFLNTSMSSSPSTASEGEVSSRPYYSGVQTDR